MKNSSPTQHCRSKTREKNSRKQKKMEHYRNAFPTSTVHPASIVPPAACSPAFHASVFLLHFFVSSNFNPCNSFCFGFFLVISYTLSTYISLSLYKLTSLHVGNRERQFPRSFLSPFSFIFFPLSRLPNTPLRMTTQRMVG